VTAKKTGKSKQKSAKKAGRPKQKSAKQTGKSKQKPAKAKAPPASQRAEEALAIASAQLSSIIESAGDVIAMLDTGYRYTLFNTAFREEFQRIFGVKLVPGDSMLQALAGLPDDLAQARTFWDRALAGEDFTVTQQFGDTALERHWYELHFSPIRDAGGGIAGAVHVVRNITERKRAEEALAQERFLLQALMNNVPDHVYFKDRDSRLIRISKTLAQSFGVSDPAQAVGKTDFDFFTEEHARQAYEDEQAVIRTGQPVSKEERETWADRPDTWVSTTKVPLRDEAGNVVGTFGISRDITESKRAEAALRESNEMLSLFLRHSPFYAYIKEVTPTLSVVLQASDSFRRCGFRNCRQVHGGAVSARTCREDDRG